MPYVRKRRYTGRRRTGITGAGRTRRSRNVARMGATNSMPIFTETMAKDAVHAQAGGNFTFAITDIPEYASYSALYRTFRILKAQVTLVPQHNVASFGNPGTTGHNGMGRIVYAINDSPNVPAPGSEADVLVDNGCKIKYLNRVTKINCKPVPDLAQSGTYTTVNRRAFIDFDTGNSLRHQGISYWINSDEAQQTYDVYYKITFQVRDPR